MTIIVNNQQATYTNISTIWIFEEPGVGSGLIIVGDLAAGMTVGYVGNAAAVGQNHFICLDVSAVHGQVRVDDFNNPVGERYPFTSPAAGIWGPKVMIINEMAGSGGDYLPWAFRRAKLGPLLPQH